jgi:hypothetical protein
MQIGVKTGFQKDLGTQRGKNLTMTSPVRIAFKRK